MVRTVLCLSDSDETQKQFQQEIKNQRNGLLEYLKNRKFTGNRDIMANNPEVKISTSDNGRVIMAEAPDLKCFDNTGFVHCYFLPFYKDGKTSFFGIKPNLINSRSSDGKNIFGLDKEGMRKILTESEMKLLELIEKSMEFPVQLSFPFIRELNI